MTFAPICVQCRHGEITHTSAIAYMSDPDWQAAHFLVTLGNIDPNAA